MVMHAPRARTCDPKRYKREAALNARLVEIEELLKRAADELRQLEYDPDFMDSVQSGRVECWDDGLYDAVQCAKHLASTAHDTVSGYTN